MSILGDLADKAKDIIDDAKESITTSDMMESAKQVMSGESTIKEEVKEMAEKVMDSASPEIKEMAEKVMGDDESSESEEKAA